MTALDCEKIQALLPLYIENELSEKETDSVRKHLENCSECQKEYAFFASMLKKLSSMPEPELPKDFHSNLMRKVHAQTPAKKTYFIDFKRIAGFAAAAAVLALSVVSYLNLEKSNEQNINPDVYLTAPAQQEEIEDKPQATETQEPIVAEKTVAPKKTSRPKAPIERNDTQGEMGGFSRVREIPEETTPEAQAATSAAPIMEQTENVPAYTNEEPFTLATVSVSETEREIAETILSNFAKEDEGYLVGENLDLVLEKLATLEGYTVTKTEDNRLTENTLFLK